MTTLSFPKFVIELESRDTPGTYIRPCGLTSKGFNRSANAVEAMVPDCDDESLPAAIQRGVASVDWDIDGAVTIKLEDLDDWEARFEAGEEVNIRITFDVDGASGGRTYTGPCVITTFNVKADIGAKAATGDIKLSGAGRLARAANP